MEEIVFARRRNGNKFYLFPIEFWTFRFFSDLSLIPRATLRPCRKHTNTVYCLLLGIVQLQASSKLLAFAQLEESKQVFRGILNGNKHQLRHRHRRRLQLQPQP